MDQVYIPKRDYRVLVKCLTYNQSKYIKDALNGFVIQQTNFPFICLIMDDCSTDGEQEVIKSWMARECDMGKAENLEIEKSHITIVPHKSNPNCHIAFYFLKQNLYKKGKKMPLISPWRECCEYEAICEGDDYWTDPKKLQKQVEFLDTNPDFTVCGHRYEVINQESGDENKDFRPQTQFCEMRLTLQDYTTNLPWVFQPLALLYRTNYYYQYKNFKDVALIFALLKKGDGYIMKDIAGVYRLNNGGIFHGVSHETKVISNIKTCIGIYEHEKDIFSVNLLKKHMKGLSRYFGKKFFLRNAKILLKSWTIIFTSHIKEHIAN